MILCPIAMVASYQKKKEILQSNHSTYFPSVVSNNITESIGAREIYIYLMADLFVQLPQLTLYTLLLL